jgi:hypothetical protein
MTVSEHFQQIQYPLTNQSMLDFAYAAIDEKREFVISSMNCGNAASYISVIRRDNARNMDPTLSK